MCPEKNTYINNSIIDPMAAKFMVHIPYGYNVSKAIVNHPEHLAFYEVVDIKIIQHIGGF